jgi:hypothetical protein
MADSKLPGPSGFDWIANNLARIAGLLTTLVGLPSLLFTCSSQEIAHRAAFQSAVASEERRWSDLHTKFFDALATKDKSAEVFNAKLELLCLLSNGKPQTFGEYPLGGFFPKKNTEDHIAAGRYITDLQNNFRQALTREGIGSKSSASCVFQQDQQAADQDSQRRPPVSTPGSAPVAVSETAQASAKIQADLDAPKARLATAATAAASLVLNAGDPKGYDIDVFWCAGPQGDAHLDYARLLATRLSAAPSGSLSMPVGRVRLRTLTEERQANPGYPRTGLQVRGEASEQDQAKALAAYLSALVPPNRFDTPLSRMKTPWYLSVFVCSAPTKG